MNTLYACAILNTKLRANTRIFQEFRPQGSNIIAQVERSTDQMRRRIGELQCRDVSHNTKEGSSISLSRDLINATTTEYCNYRHYLSYIDTVTSTRLSEVIANEEATRKKQ